MIYVNSNIYGKVWKSELSENGKYIDLQMSTSEKDADGNYRNSNWFPRAIGHAVNSLKGIADGDRICITKAKLTNERKEDVEGNKKSVFRFIILEASLVKDNSTQTAPKETPQPTTTQQPQIVDDSEDSPW